MTKNILINGSFEEDFSVGWNAWTIETTRRKDVVIDGEWSCSLYALTPSYANRGINSILYPCSPGATCRLGVNIYIADSGSGIPSSAACTHIRCRMLFYDSSLNFLQYGYWMNWYPPGHSYAERGWTDISQWDQWFYRQFDYVSPANTAYIQVELYAREINNPSPPPSGRPNNRVFLDGVYLSIGQSSYQSSDYRTIGGIGEAHSVADSRITGLLLDRGYEDHGRIVGRLLTNAVEDRYLVRGEIAYRYDYLIDPDRAFLAQEDQLCSQPRKQLLFYHPDLPENEIPGPNGETKYIDLTDRVIAYGDLNRNIPSSPGDSPTIMVSDLNITLDNSDGYFSKDNEGSLFYNLDSYVGWRSDSKIELWAGYLVNNNTIRAIRLAELVIARVSIDTSAGTAEMYLRDKTAILLDRVVGVDEPWEMPLTTFYDTDGQLMIRHSNHTTYEVVNIGTEEGVALGKIARAARMQEQMNKAVGDGGLVTDEEVFACTFDEEAQMYKFSGTGIEWMQIYTLGAQAPAFGFTWDRTFPAIPPEAEKFTEIESEFSIEAEVVTFNELITALLDEAGWSPTARNIQSIPSICFKNVKFDNSSLLDCLASASDTGSSIIWLDRKGIIRLRRFDSLPWEIKKELRGDKNYQTVIYAPQDADLQIKTIKITGKFKELEAERDTERETGSEHTLSYPLADSQFIVDDIIDSLFYRYNIEPAQLEIRGEFLPSISHTDSVLIQTADHGKIYQANVVSSVLSVGGFTHNLKVVPILSSFTWQNKDHWDDFTEEDITHRLICPSRDGRLQIALQEFEPGYRIYEIDCGKGSSTARAKWISLETISDNEDGVFFIDHFEESPESRYEVQSFEIQAKNYPVPNPGPIQHSVYGDYGKVARINSAAADRITFGHLIGMLEPDPIYIDYELRTDFLIESVYGYEEGKDWSKQPQQAQGHYFAMLIRQADVLHSNWALIRTGGLRSPLVGKLDGTPSNLVSPSARASIYAPQQSWLRAILGAEDNRLYYEVEGVTPRIETQTPLYSPWIKPAGIALGFSRCLGMIGKVELSSWLAPSAPDPQIEYRYKVKDGDTWSNWDSDIPTTESKYLQVKVTLSRDSRYITVPKMRTMALRWAMKSL